MSIGLFLSIATLLLFALLLFVAAICHGKLFSYATETFKEKKTPGECVDIMFNHYNILSDTEEKLEVNEENLNTNEIIDDTNDEESYETDEEYDNKEDEEENLSKSKTGGRVYEMVSEVIEEKPSAGRKYDSIKGFDNFFNKKDKTNEKDYKYVEIIKGKLQYKYKEGSMAVLLSEDICNNTSIPGNCTASYCACKLIESIDKPAFYKVMSLISLLPRWVSKLSWFVCLAMVFAPLPLSNNVATTIGLVCFISAVLSCLEAMYSFEIVNVTLSNMLKSGIINEDEKDVTKNMLNLVAFVDSTRFLGAFRWFANKFMGYRL